MCRARCGPAEWLHSPAGVICWPAESISFCIFNPGKMSGSGELSPEQVCLWVMSAACWMPMMKNKMSLLRLERSIFGQCDLLLLFTSQLHTHTKFWNICRDCSFLQSVSFPFGKLGSFWHGWLPFHFYLFFSFLSVSCGSVSASSAQYRVCKYKPLQAKVWARLCQ